MHFIFNSIFIIMLHYRFILMVMKARLFVIRLQRILIMVLNLLVPALGMFMHVIHLCVPIAVIGGILGRFLNEMIASVHGRSVAGNAVVRHDILRIGPTDVRAQPSRLRRDRATPGRQLRNSVVAATWPSWTLHYPMRRIATPTYGRRSPDAATGMSLRPSIRSKSGANSPASAATS